MSADRGQMVTTLNPQMDLDLRVEREMEIDGVGMGVLSDGTPFLNARGLARMCGVDHTAIQKLGESWGRSEEPPRVRRIRESLAHQGIELLRPYIEVKHDGVFNHAYPDSVCMAVLEYYAFEAKRAVNSVALRNYRLLARASFKQFIYTKIGYDPRGVIPVAWQQFHDRVTAAYNGIPAGYFSVFKEIADIIVELIRGGAEVGFHFVPDISVGTAWSSHWQALKLDKVHGERTKYEHNYPEYFPQSATNPQPAFCYPDSSLPEFRRWIRETYLPEKLPKYLATKIKQGMLPPSFSEIARIMSDGSTVKKKPRKPN